ncbi:hypothetical protein JKP88DRAFT_325064, partial [Tribonema minus]
MMLRLLTAQCHCMRSTSHRSLEIVSVLLRSHFRCAATARAVADNLARGAASIFTAYTLLHVERARVDAIDLSSPPAPMYVSMGRAMSVKLYRRERRRGSGTREVEDEGGAHEGGPINIAGATIIISSSGGGGGGSSSSAHNTGLEKPPQRRVWNS